MKVLITGGAGFIGSHLSDAFIARGDEVFVLDMAEEGKVRHLLGEPRFHFIHDSVLNSPIVDALVDKVDLVYHLAAVVGVEHYVADPYSVLNVNINGTQNVLRAAYRSGKKVVFSSTSEVYGRNPKVPFDEHDERVLGSTRIDRWCYSTSKAAGEHFCFAYQRMGLPVVITRYFNVYGPRLDQTDMGRVITIFIGQILRKQPITLVNGGAQTRCFTYVSDAIRATVAAGLKAEANGEIFNIGTAEETTIRRLAELMVKLTNHGAGIVDVPQEKVYGKYYEDVSRRVPSVNRMEDILGVKMTTPLEVGLKLTLDWFFSQARP
jgi:UDP-glucose 4-epimerase